MTLEVSGRTAGAAWMSADRWGGREGGLKGQGRCARLGVSGHLAQESHPVSFGNPGWLGSTLRDLSSLVRSRVTPQCGAGGPRYVWEPCGSRRGGGQPDPLRDLPGAVGVARGRPGVTAQVLDTRRGGCGVAVRIGRGRYGSKTGSGHRGSLWGRRLPGSRPLVISMLGMRYRRTRGTPRAAHYHPPGHLFKRASPPPHGAYPIASPGS